MHYLYFNSNTHLFYFVTKHYSKTERSDWIVNPVLSLLSAMFFSICKILLWMNFGQSWVDLQLRFCTAAACTTASPPVRVWIYKPNRHFCAKQSQNPGWTITACVTTGRSSFVASRSSSSRRRSGVRGSQSLCWNATPTLHCRDNNGGPLPFWMEGDRGSLTLTPVETYNFFFFFFSLSSKNKVSSWWSLQPRCHQTQK